MAKTSSHTQGQIYLTVLALRKLRAGEPVDPKSCTREHFGDYLTLVEDMRTSLVKAMAGAEDQAAITNAMDAYWSAVRLDKRYRDIVDAVDAMELEEAAKNGQPAAASPSGVRPLIRHADQVEPQPVKFLWYPYIPRDMPVMLDGDPGLSKGLMIVQVATNLSRERPFLDQLGQPTMYADVKGPQPTLILTAEESLEHTMVPRLIKAGADRRYIKFLTGWLSEDGTEHAFDLHHLPVLVQAIEEVKPVLVILDPLVAYLGDIDMHRSNHTRPVMAALKNVAERYHCTIMGVRHPSKVDQGGPLMYCGQGNMDIIGAARSGLWVQKHPTHPETHTIMLHSKTNVGILGRTAIFTHEYGEFAWKGMTRLTEAMLTGKGPDPHAFLEAFFWLEEIMKPGIAYPSAAIEKQAEEREISQKVLKRARKMLGVIAKQEGSRWYSILPPLSTTTRSTGSTGATGSTGYLEPISITYDVDGQEPQEDPVAPVSPEDPVGPVVIRAREGERTNKRWPFPQPA
jgi:AAA domain